MPYTTVIYIRKGHVAHIILNRPEANNAINQQLARELEEICGQINQDNDIYVVIVTGAGDKAFCDGAELESAGPWCSPAGAVAGIDRPVIAAIDGDAMGAGLELALSCDIRLASAKARFGLPQVARGLIPMDGGTQRLPRIVGRGKAMELLLTAEMISAEEALEIGLVSRVVPPEKLAGEVEALAGNIAAKGPIALRYIKEAVNKGLDMTLEQGLRLEADLDDGSLIDARVLVGPFVFDQCIDIDSGVRLFLAILIGTDNDSGGVDIFDNPIPLGHHCHSRIPCHNRFHSGSDQWRIRP